MCNKRRLIELMHHFVLFDGGVKKLPRVHQYFGIKAAQEHVREKRGGIIWHTQGSGKSIVMVLLAKWILENNANARVAIITDRDELDKQIDALPRTSDKYSGRAVVILGGGSRYEPGIYVAVKMHRLMGWTGPIQIWHRCGDTQMGRSFD